MTKMKKTSAALMAAAVLTLISGCSRADNNSRTTSHSNSHSESLFSPGIFDTESTDLEEQTSSVTEESNASPQNPGSEYWVDIDFSDETCFTVENNEDGVTITKINGGAEEVKIPSTISGRKVTKIGHHAFENSYITAVYIPESISVIEWGVFDNCTRLSTIYISEGVTEVGHHAFNKCNSLTYVYFPDSMERIGDAAFALCYNLESASIPQDCFTGIGSFDELHKNNGFNLEKRLTLSGILRPWR